MATTFTVAGPCDIYVALTGAAGSLPGTWQLLGRTANDQMAAFSIVRGIREKTTTASGDAPEEAVQNNQYANISFVLEAYDQTVISSLRARIVADGAASGAIATVGAVMVGGIGSQDPCIVGIRIVPRIAGRTYWEFAACLVSEPEDIGPFGNDVVQVGIRAKAIPWPATNRLFTKGTTPPS